MKDAATELMNIVNFMNFTHFALEEIQSRSWASATFAGARHALTFRLEGETAEAEADAFLSGIEEREFNLSGHILADIALVSRTKVGGGVRISLEALTVEEG